MIISAIAISPRVIVLGQAVDIIVLTEGVDPSALVEICVSVGWPFAIDGRAMLCQTVMGSESASFRALVTCKTVAATCHITALAAADDGQGCRAYEVVEVNLKGRASV